MLKPITLKEFLAKYKTNDDCLNEIVAIKYPNGIKCKKCNKITNHYKLKSRKSYSCQFCGSQTAPLANTVFHKSSTDLLDWFYAIYLITQAKSGMSALHLQRILGNSYKTSWRMFHQIRKLMSDTNEDKLDGIVEVDETFVGGKTKNRKNKFGQGTQDKAVVMGMIKRGGKAYLKHIESTGKWALREQIEKYVSPTATVMTDDYKGYIQLKKMGYKHYAVNHSKYQYRKGEAYTQNAENVWSHLKRGIYGVYHSVSKRHLQKYVDEFAFRYNNRKSADMFNLVLSKIALS